jgi:hypothetical protein
MVQTCFSLVGEFHMYCPIRVPTEPEKRLARLAMVTVQRVKGGVGRVTGGLGRVKEKGRRAHR